MRRHTILIVVAGLSFGSSALATEIIVPTQMPLTLALATAASGDTITLLASGSPYQTFPGYSFAGKALLIRGSTGNPADVVIDGYGLDIALRIDGAGAAGTVLQDLTIRNGRGATTANANGAGLVLTNGASTTLRHCVVRDNVNPSADGNGAGIYVSSGSLRLEDCLVENNTLTSNVGDGGGVYATNSYNTYARTTFRNNGIASTVTPASGAIGGALYAEIGTCTFVQCRVEGNRGWDGAGLAIGGSGIAQVDACEFVNNVGRYGPGFYVTSNAGGATIRNCVFRGNSAGADYAAACLLRSVAMINCTFAGNTATGNYVLGGAANSTLDNCVVYGNTIGTAGLIPANHAIARSNILQAAITGATGSRNNIVADPKLASSTDPRLTSGSPGIDAGDGTLYSGPFVDFAGAARAVDDPTKPDTGVTLLGPVIDIGAYEFSPATCPADVDDGSGVGLPDGAVTIDDLLYFLARYEGGC